MRQPQNRLRLLLRLPIIKHNKMRCRHLYQRRCIKRLIPHQHLVLLCHIHQKAQRHIRIPGGLMFIKVQLHIKQKRLIILHVHINRIFQRHNLKLRCICVMRMIHRIIKTQQILPRAENHPKQRILVIPLHFYRIPTSHSFSLLAGEFPLFF